MTFVSRWAEIASTLGLKIVSPVEVILPDGRTVCAPVLLKNFGYENGMVLFEDTPGDIFELGRALIASGYGYSCLGAYREAVDLELVKEMLADWTWAGPPDQRPTWLPDPPQDADDI